MELKQIEIPSTITKSAHGMRFADYFTIQARIKADFTAGKQVIFSKRHPAWSGNTPGIILMLRGTIVSFWTFADGDEKWTHARSGRGYIKAGSWHDIVVIRSADMAQIYIDNVDRTHPQNVMVSGGDVNCDNPAYIGIDMCGNRAGRKFYGEIPELALYNQRKVS